MDLMISVGRRFSAVQVLEKSIILPGCFPCMFGKQEKKDGCKAVRFWGSSCLIYIYII